MFAGPCVYCGAPIWFCHCAQVQRVREDQEREADRAAIRDNDDGMMLHVWRKKHAAAIQRATQAPGETRSEVS